MATDNLMPFAFTEGQSPKDKSQNIIKVIGVGGKPEKGKEAAEASLDAVKTLFEDNTEMVFITCGMGGGTF